MFHVIHPQVKNPLLDSSTAVFMLQVIFQKVTVGTLVRGDRLLVYRIFEYLLERRLEGLWKKDREHYAIDVVIVGSLTTL